MRETTTTTQEHAGAKMCWAGASTDSPCWRPATERDIGETEPTLCAEHMELRNRAESMDGWLHTLDAMRAFLESKAVVDDDVGILRELAAGWFDTVTEQAADAAHKMRVAEFLADQGPGNRGPKDAVMREYGASLHVRSDAINDALATLTDEQEPSETERLLIIAAFKEASGRVNRDYHKFREEQGWGYPVRSPAPRPEGEHMERHTVAYSFEGEKVSFVAGEHGDLTLYRRDDGAYLVHLDARKVGDDAVLEVGAYPRGLSEHDIRCMWPELLEAQSRQ